MTPSDQDKGKSKGKGKGKSSKRRRVEAGEPSPATPSAPQPRQTSEGMDIDRPSPRTHHRDRKLARVRKAKHVVEEPSKTPSPERPDPSSRLQEVSVDNLTDQLNALYVSSLLIKFVPGMEALDNDFIVGSRLKKVSQKIRSARAAKDYHPLEKPKGRKAPQKHLTKKEVLKKHPRLSPRSPHAPAASALPLPTSLSSLSDRDILAIMMTRSRYLRLVIDGTTHESALDRLRIDYGNHLRLEDLAIVYELGQEIQTSLMKHKSVAKATQTSSDGASTSQAASAREASLRTYGESTTEPEATETDTEESDDDEEIGSHEEGDSNGSD